MLKRREFLDAARRKLCTNTNLHVMDNDYIQIENCKKILEYNDIYLKIRTSNMILQVWGQSLNISDCNNDGIIVRGEISSIEFEKK